MKTCNRYTTASSTFTRTEHRKFESRVARPSTGLRLKSRIPLSNRRYIGRSAAYQNQGRQYETEFFRKLFGTPPPPKQDGADGGGGDEPPAGGHFVEEEEEPDEEQLAVRQSMKLLLHTPSSTPITLMQVQRAKQQARQQAVFNCISVVLFVGTLISLSTLEPHFLYLGRVWRCLRGSNQTQAYAELATEGFAWVLLLTMGWPWNLLIYPTHLTRKELTNARKEHRGPTMKNVVNSIYNPFARRKRPPPVVEQP